MGVEREAKYQVLDQALFRRLAAMDHLGNFALEHTGIVDIVTVYLDTPDLVLFHAGYAMRFRLMQGRTFLSLKGPSAPGDAHIQERSEEEVDAPGFSEKALPQAADIVRLMPSAADTLHGLMLSVSLKSASRRALHYAVLGDERAFEIACDTVVFTSPRVPGHRADATELEIEQKAGSDSSFQELMHVFEALFAIVPRRASSKYQDGLKGLSLI
jgi:inorganic triphosphatase YgiF